jgi:hypothetical protein
MNSAEAMKLLLSDRRLFIETLISIEDKNRQIVPFVLNSIQLDMYETSIGRDVYVKPAQIGGSSYIICDFLIDCLTIPGTTAVIISFDEFITGRLLRKAQTFYDILQEKIPSIPELHHKSTYEKTFKGVNSSLYISSSRSFAMPRGEPVHDLLLDEFAFWAPGAAGETFAATLQRVPLLPNTKVRVLSTPNGEDNDFFEIYHAAKEGKEVGKSVFKHHFYTWYQHPEYSLPPDNDFVLPDDGELVLKNIDSDENNLLIRFEQLGFTEEKAHNKLRWRRYKIAEMSSLRRSGETRLLFPQEFPEDDVTCFQSAGDMWYDSELINSMARNCYPAPMRNLFADIWYDREDGLNYLVAIDPGLGKTSESVATVWTFRDGYKVDGQDYPPEFKHCATLSGLYEDYDMAAKAKELAKYYNNAMIAPEDSLGIVSHLRDYPSLYYRTDPASGLIGKQIGWQTNTKTKIFMCNELLRCLPHITTHDIRFISQLRNIRDVGGRPMAIGSDDYHDSVAIAMVCRSSASYDVGLVGTKGWGDSWGSSKRRR